MAKPTSPIPTTPIAAFAALKNRVDTLLAQLADASANHFGADPESLHWGHVGDLARLAIALEEAVTAAGPMVAKPT